VIFKLILKHQNTRFQALFCHRLGHHFDGLKLLLSTILQTCFLDELKKKIQNFICNYVQNNQNDDFGSTKYF
jgi:hypothetical protein